jgi:SHS2 domain-containing protein
MADLFETAARAMFSLEYDLSSVPADDSRPLAAHGDDLEAALYSWLSELLWLHDAEGFAIAEVRVESAEHVTSGADAVGGAASEAALVRGVALGATMGEWFVQAGPQLKAVTMHGLAVTRRAGGGYEATVYIDV